MRDGTGTDTKATTDAVNKLLPLPPEFYWGKKENIEKETVGKDAK
jgi:hypothetical protein